MRKGFISYAHADHRLVKEFGKDLNALGKVYEVEFWSDVGIRTGDLWDARIGTAIAEADVFVLMLSRDFFDSDYIKMHEAPKIAARKGMMCPVLLSPCVWKYFFNERQLAPMRGRKPVSIVDWNPRAGGFDAARAQIGAAIEAHFNLKPKHQNWFGTVRDLTEPQPSPIWFEENGQFDIDQSGGDADSAAAGRADTQADHAANQKKAAAFVETLAASHNRIGSEWSNLGITAQSLSKLLTLPTADLPDRVDDLWGASKEIASFLAMDDRLTRKQTFDQRPLPANVRQALDSLVGSVAPFVRRFPSVWAMDAKDPKVPADAAMLPSAEALRAIGTDNGLLAEAASDYLRRKGDSAKRDGDAPTAAIVVRGLRGAIALAAGRVVRLKENPPTDPALRRPKVLGPIAAVLTLGASHIETLFAGHPADIQHALKLMMQEAAAENFPYDGAVEPNVSTPTSDPRPFPWADRWGRDEYGQNGDGRWLIFSVPGADGSRVEQRMRWIERGEFWMGSPDDETGRFGQEGPRHWVTIEQGFWLFDTPCTQALWEATLGANRSWFKSPTRPVEQVSFTDVSAFLATLNDRVEGLNLTLPSEAQWEYACRAGTETATYAGPMRIVAERNAPILDGIAWYGGNSGVGFELANGYDSSKWPEKQYGHTRAGTHPVGQKAPNAWGLYDMLGNVWEWCEDNWHDTYRNAPANGSPTRVVRGGSWLDTARYVRAAFRLGDEPGGGHIGLGFRCARGQA